MNAYDPQLQEQQWEVEALKARLTQQENGGHRRGRGDDPGCVSPALLSDPLLRGEWPPENLSGSIHNGA